MMKRLVIVLLVLTVLGAFAFADGKFTAWNYGLAIPYAMVGSNNAQAGWGPNFDSPVGRGPDNEWVFGYDGKGYGFSAALEFGLTMTAGGQPGLAIGNTSWQWWGTYYKPFGDVLKITLGAPRVDYVQWTYLEGFGAYSRFINSDLSVTAEIMPVPGLTIGLANYIPILGVVGLPLPLNMGNFATGANLDFGNNIAVLGSYKMDNMGTLTVQYKRQDSNGGGSLTSSSLGVGAAVSAIPGIAINAGLGYDTVNSLATVSASTKITMLNPLTVMADVAFKQVTSSLNSFAFEVGGEFAVGTLGIGAQVGYDDGNGVGLIGELASAAWTGIEIQPYLVANFDNGSYIRVGFVYASGAGSGAASQSVIAIPITYLWAF